MDGKKKVWFITGCSTGFGRALAEEVLTRGECVVATARDPQAVEDLASRAPLRVLSARLDVTRAGDIEAAVSAALERFGAIDVLVNNAGYSVLGAVEETTEAELRAAFETMFFGAVALTREVLPTMRDQRRGTIVQLASVGGFTTAPGFGAYCAVKHGLEGLSECLAAEVAPLGIRVLIVEPGAFRTSLFGSAFRMLPAMSVYSPTVGPTREYVESNAGKQPGDPAKAAHAIFEAVGAGAPTLRLPLGEDAVSLIRAKLEAMTTELDQTETVAKATSFDT